MVGDGAKGFLFWFQTMPMVKFHRERLHLEHPMVGITQRYVSPMVAPR